MRRDSRGRGGVGAVNGDRLAKLRRPELYRWHALVLSRRWNARSLAARAIVGVTNGTPVSGSLPDLGEDVKDDDAEDDPGGAARIRCIRSRMMPREQSAHHRRHEHQ
jgi:hypothetical protein